MNEDDSPNKKFTKIGEGILLLWTSIADKKRDMLVGRFASEYQNLESTSDKFGKSRITSHNIFFAATVQGTMKRALPGSGRILRSAKCWRALSHLRHIK
jgi:hypothetical protein